MLNKVTFITMHAHVHIQQTVSVIRKYIRICLHNIPAYIYTRKPVIAIFLLITSV